MNYEAEQLKAFLTSARRRNSRASKGLPQRRIDNGLRREDTAELLGVTPLWYALFESGSSGRRFSAAFLERVSVVLSLSPAETETLTRLVIASGTASCDLQERTTSRYLFQALAELAELSSNLARARSFELAGGEISRFVRSFLRPVHATFHLVVAPNASLPSNPSSRSLITVPVVKDGRLEAIMRISSPFASAFFDADLQVMEIVAMQLAKYIPSVRRKHTPEAVVYAM